MRADADLEPRRSDRGKFGSRQILLAEMDEVRALIDRLPPIVVDHQLASMRGAKPNRRFNLGADDASRLVLDSELHQPEPKGQETGEPIRIGEDGIERIEADQSGRATGIDQEA